ncbi:MAG: RibD family protein, partial [Pyrinomonadaceae bacterium]
ALQRVHELRHDHDAILVGGNTAFVDNPSLTDRSGLPRRRPLLRVILDNRLRIPLSSTLVDTAADTPTLVFTNSGEAERVEQLRKNGVDVFESEHGGRDLDELLAELGKRQIQSVLVEGGSEVAGAFFDAKLVDRLTLIVAPIVIGGHDAPLAIGGKGAASLEEALRLDDLEINKFEPDIEITGCPR